jgi:alkylated DNA repair dioxygenase AlkB
MLDLFEAPVVSGFSTATDFVSAAEEAELIAQIDATGLTPFRFHQWTGKRLTRSFDWSYDFETDGFEQTDPIPNWLKPLRSRAAKFVGLQPEDLVQTLLIRYDPGATIGWHKDQPVFVPIDAACERKR